VPRSLLIILAIALALPASASDIGAVKCAVNQDRVWVYESLSSFDVETRLKCGDTVEILSRVKGYVKIRTASGLEGYVPDAVFPDLPALPPDDTDKPVRSVAVRPAASAAARPAAAPMTVASTATPSAPPIVAPTVAGPKPPATPENSAVVAPSAPEAVNVKPAPPAPPHTQTRVKAAAPAAVVEPAAPKKSLAKPAPSTTQTAKKTVTVPSPQPLASTPAVVPAKATVAPTSAKMMDTSANASPARDISIAKPEAASSDLEDYPDARPENESADPACRVFFSAYGLAPAQYKWLVENRRKQYADICPAPDLSRVDYVILFAHDSDTYNSAMPAPVHTDRNGFSDFSPMTTVDTALQSISELDKARYEFVWVFHTNRGTFDPARFSARRRPQFTTDAKGSHASARAAEDAFHFIEGQGSPDR
jgi:hypothetical protein